MSDSSTASVNSLKGDLDKTHQRTLALYKVQTEYAEKSNQAKISAQTKKDIIEKMPLR